MEDNILKLIYFPELILVLGSLFLIIIALFINKNVYNIIAYLSIILLLVVGAEILINKDIVFASYNFFFTITKFTIFFKLLTIFGSILCIIISINYFHDIKLAKFEIPILILFSTLGMLVLIGSNNLMSMYLGIELQSLSLYVLAAVQRNSLKSAESGIKYFVLGALSSGILLYGCSLIYGFTGSANFYEIKVSLSQLNNLNIGILFGLIFILTGLAFKVSAVPFHMWTPDVYEGAPTPITAFFAIVPKVAGVALLYRFCLEPFINFYFDWRQIIIFLSIASMFLGAIAAIVQTNLKRLLAYSSIGHIGYVLIGLASANHSGIKAVIIYMLIYVLMNVVIFAILLSTKINHKYIENIKELSGISNKKPIISICIAIIMFSMAGIPPFSGFFGKFYIFISALEADLIYLAILGVLASVISAFYYLRIIKVMYFDKLIEDQFESNFSTASIIVVLFAILFTVLFVFFPSLVIEMATTVSSSYNLY